MLVKTFSASVQGLQAAEVTVEVNSTRGARFALVGLPDSAVKESYERILAAIENSGYTFPGHSITINMAPADVRKEGSGFDLPMAIGILATSGQVDTHVLNRYMMVGELSLDGSLQPIKGALPISIKAENQAAYYQALDRYAVERDLAPFERQVYEHEKAALLDFVESYGRPYEE